MPGAVLNCSWHFLGKAYLTQNILHLLCIADLKNTGIIQSQPLAQSGNIDRNNTFPVALLGAPCAPVKLFTADSLSG